jgi:hypothetical protein
MQLRRLLRALPQQALAQLLAPQPCRGCVGVWSQLPQVPRQHQPLWLLRQLLQLM